MNAHALSASIPGNATRARCNKHSRSHPAPVLSRLPVSTSKKVALLYFLKEEQILSLPSPSAKSAVTSMAAARLLSRRTSSRGRMCSDTANERRGGGAIATFTLKGIPDLRHWRRDVVFGKGRPNAPVGVLETSEEHSMRKAPDGWRKADESADDQITTAVGLSVTEVAALRLYKQRCVIAQSRCKRVLQLPGAIFSF